MSGNQILMTQAQYARHRNKSPQYIGKLYKAGVLVMRGRLMDAVVSDAVLDDKPVERSAPDSQQPATSYAQAKLADMVFRAKLRRLEFETRQGKLIEAAIVRERWAAILVMLKERVLALCDLKNHRVYDVVLGRSEAALEAYLQRLEGKQDVRVVCMDLSVTYRALVKKYFPRARIVADRFHVIRLINQHFLASWREIDPLASKHRGLLSLMRRHRHNLKPHQKVRLAAYLAEHPVLEVIYRFKQRLCYLLLKKPKTRKKCERLAPRLLAAIEQLKAAGQAPLVALGHTLEAWTPEIGCMWRFTRNNGITEGFHNKMETISRVAYGFRNFENYRLRVKVLCS